MFWDLKVGCGEIRGQGFGLTDGSGLRVTYLVSRVRGFASGFIPSMLEVRFRCYGLGFNT
jgi:hypothetical protein